MRRCIVRLKVGPGFKHGITTTLRFKSQCNCHCHSHSGISRPILCVRSISSDCTLGINFMLSFRKVRVPFRVLVYQQPLRLLRMSDLLFCCTVLACHFVVLETLISVPRRLYCFFLSSYFVQLFSLCSK